MPRPGLFPAKGATRPIRTQQAAEAAFFLGVRLAPKPPRTMRVGRGRAMAAAAKP